MNIFKTFRLTWWQAGIFKISLIAIGIAIGAIWSNIFAPIAGILAIIGVMLGFFIGNVWWKQ